MTANTAPKIKVPGRDRHVRHALGDTLYSNIRNAKVLMVGAGGIGCELLKNLVLTGFGEVEIVDLDTIDLSNLNRQFLFRHEHIKKSKALIAKETASKFNPNVKITAHHANVKDKVFNVGWFRSFRIVFNALDNLDARRHVNRMCLAAKVPLVESGTTGFEGQVQVIKKGVTECYDCNPKPTPKSYPVCTIRSTPSQPIHCIVWAKSYLFTEIFGTSEDEGKELDHSEDIQNAEEISQLRQEARELQQIRKSMGGNDFARLVFTKVFDTDIERLRSMEDMWKSRTPPTAMKYDEAAEAATGLDGAHIASQDQIIWSVPQNIAVFQSSLARLSHRLKALQDGASNQANGNANGAVATSSAHVLSFDKDDKDTLDFVASAANLRSVVFGIEPKSEFDIKQMAGNIIPAIATTNAMTASLCVLQAFKILRDQMSKAKMVFLAPRNPARVVSSESPRPPNKACAVCSVATAEVKVDLGRAKLRDLVEGVLKEKLGYGEEISVSTETGLVYDPDYEDNLDKKLSELGVGDGATVTVVDEDDGEEMADGTLAPRVNLSLQTKEETMKEPDGPIMLQGEVAIERRPREVDEPVPEPEIGKTNGHSNGALPDMAGSKRKREANEDGVQEVTNRAKKARVSDGDDEVLLVEDSASTGAIVIDDD